MIFLTEWKMSDIQSNKLAIIVCFYLSKYDKKAKQTLGYSTDHEAFLDISIKLGVKKNYLKFRRDEFDPIHPWRKGWTRPMDTRIIRTIEALQDLTEEELGGIVTDILTKPEFRTSQELSRLSDLIEDESSKKNGTKNSILRGPTGKKAEEFFKQYFNQNDQPVAGKLIDTRDYGCGYDFEIQQSNDQSVFVEVKGLSQTSGGILFTNKEWETAKKHKKNYVIALVTNIDDSPRIRFISNPAETLQPKRNIITTVQTQWSVSNTELNDV
jgi:hypothetical protein